jgi:hypothetical protein
MSPERCDRAITRLIVHLVQIGCYLDAFALLINLDLDIHIAQHAFEAL